MLIRAGNLGEEHTFELKLGLFRVDYTHISKARQNQVGRIALSTALDDACSSSGAATNELVSVSSSGCDIMLGARRLALAAVKVIACVAVVLLLSLRFNNFFVAILLLCALSGLAILLACLARGAALIALDNCVIYDSEARSRLSGEASLAALACSRIELGSGSYVFMLACALHGAVATYFRTLFLHGDAKRSVQHVGS